MLQGTITKNYISDGKNTAQIDDADAEWLKGLYNDYLNAQKEYDDWKKRAYAGEALQLASAFVPAGAVGNALVKGLTSGLVGGAMEGFGRGLVEDENPIKTAAYDAAIGGLTGGALGGAAPVVGKKVVLPIARKMEAGINPLARTYKAVLADSSNPLHRLQADLINKYNPAPDDYHTWIRNADDIYTFEDTLKPPQFDPDFIGNDFDPSYTWDMAQDAIKNGEMEVFSSYPIEKGTFVTPSQMEAQSYAGNGNIYSKKVPLKDVAWIDQSQGQYAPIDKEYMEYALDKTQEEIAKMTPQELEDFENIGLDYYTKYLQNEPVKKEGYGDIYFSGKNKGKDFTPNFRHFPTLKEQLRTSQIGKLGSNYKKEVDRVYDYLINTKNGEKFKYTIEDIKGKGKRYKKMKSNNYFPTDNQQK